jgi:uncharacterized delta-60 repeat protein
MTRIHFMSAFLILALAASAPIPVLAADGELDPTFGIGGRVRYEDSSGYPLSARASAIQSDGKIIVAGSIGVPPDGADFVLVRFKTDGSLDATFGIGGKVTTDFGQWDWATAIAIQPDGKIIAAGTGGTASNRDFALARYSPDGSPDVTFGVGGKVTTDFYGLHENVGALAIQSDGKIVAAGLVYQSGLATSSDFGLVRFNPNGSLDTAFGIDGKATTDFLGWGDAARAVAIQSDGKTVAAGMMVVPPSRTPYSGLRSGRGALVRYNNDGSLDTTFGTGGKVITEIMGTSEVNALSIQSDGKIIAAGRSLSVNDNFLPGPNGADFGLVRYNEDGSLDMTFGAQGKVTTDLNSTGESIYAVSVQPDGKIIAAGESDLFDDWWPATVFGLARYNRDGSPDTTFGIGGKVRMDLPVSQFEYVRFEYARFVGIQPGGKIVVTGGGETLDANGNPQSTSFELARFDATGLQIVSAIDFRAAIVEIGDSFDATLWGSNLTDRTYFDLRFRSPGSTTDQVAPNWQQGTSAQHTVPAGTEPGTWIVTGIRAHESFSDQGGEFVPVSGSIGVEK